MRYARRLLALNTVRAAFYGVFLVAAGQAQAQLDISHTQRASDGTVYEVVEVPTGSLPAGAVGMRVTTVAGGPNGLTSCSNAGSNAGQAASAVVGADRTLIVAQQLHAYHETFRTGILTPNDLNYVTFDITGSGRLTIGTSWVVRGRRSR
jgi:hypothetical protein